MEKGYKSEKEKVSTKQYEKVHRWLRKHYGPAVGCEGADCTGVSRRYEWAKVRGRRYECKRQNFIQLCKRCHALYDFTENTREWQKKVNVLAKRTHCLRGGHPLTEENVFRKAGTRFRECRICRRELKAKYRANFTEQQRENRLIYHKAYNAAYYAKRKAEKARREVLTRIERLSL